MVQIVYWIINLPNMRGKYAESRGINDQKARKRNFAISTDFAVPLLVYLCNIWNMDLGFTDGKDKRIGI